MINNYEIKTINKEQVLFLYLDANTEFAKTNIKDKKATLNKEVKDYCKKNKINFKGTKIVLMAGSLLLGTLLLKEPMKNYDDFNYNYTPNKIVLNNDYISQEEDTNIQEDNTEEIVEESTPEKEESNTTTSNNNSTTNKNNTNTSNSNTTNNSSNKVTNTTPSKAPSTSTNETSTSTPSNSVNNETTNTSNALMVTVKRSNGTILNIELEEYLVGVVAAEMPASFQTEALKAQAIAARTYALKAIQSGITLTDTVSTQAYSDETQLKNLWGSSFNTYYNKVKSAVNATSGLVMKYNNTLINAYYHSTSNGYTEDSSYVFGEYPYLKSVASPLDQNVSSYLRTVTFSYEEISNKLGIPVTPLSEIIINRNTSNRVGTIIIDNNIYDGVKFRTTLGLRSTDFDFILNEDNITITTRGYGHGVGMSQYGANEYAKTGWGYSQILTHYYTGITISHY